MQPKEIQYRTYTIHLEKSADQHRPAVNWSVCYNGDEVSTGDSQTEANALSVAQNFIDGLTFESFLTGYLANLQANQGDENNENFEGYEFALSTVMQAREYCSLFFNKHIGLIIQYAEKVGAPMPFEFCGADFSATCNGGAVGFMNRGLPANLAEMLNIYCSGYYPIEICLENDRIVMG